MKRARERQENDWTFPFALLPSPPSLALFISCVSIYCLYGFRRLEYSASCVSPGSETEDFHLWAECLGKGKGAIGLLPGLTT